MKEKMLYIPIKVNAFAVNKKIYNDHSTNIRRDFFNYEKFEKHLISPKPDAFSEGRRFKGTGMIIHWSLPESLMTSKIDEKGNLDFPLVPDRWFIYRISGSGKNKKTDVWVLNSFVLGDHDPTYGGAEFLDPYADKIESTKVGKLYKLTKYNIDGVNPDHIASDINSKGFLTAFGPGNDLFASFQPYNENVFSMFDPLEGVENRDILSYFVSGNYHNPESDIINTMPFDELLSDMGWFLPDINSDQQTPKRSIFHGAVYNINWDIEGSEALHIPSGDSVKIVLGETTTDALDALQKHQSGQEANMYNELYSAWERGILHYYDETDAHEKIKKENDDYRFSSHNGGYYWMIEDSPENTNSTNKKSNENLKDKHTKWLAQLNINQDKYDTESRNLESLRRELYEVWWKFNFLKINEIDPYPDGTSYKQFQDALDSHNSGSLISRVSEQMNIVASLQKKIPFGITDTELQQSIIRFGQNQGLSVELQLRRHHRPLFRSVNEPVILFQGLKNKEPLIRENMLQVRFDDHLINAFTFSGRKIQQQDLKPLFPDIYNNPIFYEFLLLNPALAFNIANEIYKNSNVEFIHQLEEAMANRKEYSKYIPEYDNSHWSQPWLPVMAQYHIAWYPINEGASGESLWEFNGTYFVWKGKKGSKEIYPKEFKMTSSLLPLTGFSFRSSVKRMIEDNQNDNEVRLLNNFYNELPSTDDFLSTSMYGFSDFFSQRIHGPTLSPDYDSKEYFPGYKLSFLLGNKSNRSPDGGIMYNNPKESNFHLYRAGQFYIRRLHIIDAFGQVCELITNDRPMDHEVILSPGLTPDVPVFNKGYTLCQLPPRMLQPWRLNIHQISCTDDNVIVEHDHQASPVCGFLLHNFINENIACYDHSGIILGSIRMVKKNTSPEIVWNAAPGSKYQKIDLLIADAKLKHLGLFLKGIVENGIEEFQLLMKYIDMEDTMTDEADSKFVHIAGRPIALVRVKLQLESQGKYIKDPSWKQTFSNTENTQDKISFPTRIGNAEKANDALFGYFLDNDYNTFYTDSAPISSSEYIKPIGNGESVSLSLDNKNGVCATLLMHPRLPVSVKTGILPATEYHISEQFITPVFENMQVSFSTGPILSESFDDNTETEHFLKLPHSKIKNGQWLWQQWNKEKNNWQSFPLVNPNDYASMNDFSLVYKEGYLHFYPQDEIE